MDNEKLKEFGLANYSCHRCIKYESGKCGGAAVTCEEYEENEE